MCVYRDSYRILGWGGDSTPRGVWGGMFPQEFFLKTNALRLILGHFLMLNNYAYPCQHTSFIQEVMHSCKIDVFCCNYAK